MISLNSNLSPEDLAFREEVRAFLVEAFTPELREASARQAGLFAEGDLSRRWHRILYERGWVAPSWPKEYGGPGFTPIQRHIFLSECAEAGTPSLPAMGLQMCGPVIMRFGTEAQKDFFLPRMLSGEHYWCQGYSEPHAGSDLASLQCRAVRDGDRYIVNGQKIWTTHAHNANWIFLLVRTSTEGRPQSGITFLLAPMNSPGIRVRPIISISGEHEINEVFFDDVGIPVANRIGEENEGWSVAKFLLVNERGGGSAGAVLKNMLAKVRAILEVERSDDGGGLMDDAHFRKRLADVEIEITAIDIKESMTVAALGRGETSLNDATASVMKLGVSETMQSLTELAMAALGNYARADQGSALYRGSANSMVGPPHDLTPMAKYLNMRAITIFGGSSEVQRNILARVALGI